MTTTTRRPLVLTDDEVRQLGVYDTHGLAPTSKLLLAILQNDLRGALQNSRFAEHDELLRAVSDCYNLLPSCAIGDADRVTHHVRYKALQHKVKTHVAMTEARNTLSLADAFHRVTARTTRDGCDAHSAEVLHARTYAAAIAYVQRVLRVTLGDDKTANVTMGTQLLQRVLDFIGRLGPCPDWQAAAHDVLQHYSVSYEVAALLLSPPVVGGQFDASA